MGVLLDWLITGVFMSLFDWIFSKISKKKSSNANNLENKQEVKNLENP